jgi:hypothetical protein
MSLTIETTASAVEISSPVSAVAIESAPPASVTISEDEASITIESAPATVTIDTLDASVTINTTQASIEINAIDTPAISLADHDALESLAHEIAESNDTEYVTDGDGYLTQITVWTSALHTRKIREKLLTYGADGPTLTVETQYDNTGAAVATLTKSFTYSSGVLVSTTTVRS